MTTLTIDPIQKALQQSLPGQSAQLKMAPQRLEMPIDRWEHPNDCRDAGVLILLYPHQTLNDYKEWHIILTRRPEYLGVHSGQISLPGGRRETDETLQATALRETYEEVGVLAQTITIIGALTPLYTPPSNFCIHPFVGSVTHRPNFKADPIEVAELIESPLNLLRDPTIHQKEVWTFPNGIQNRVPYFDILGHKVWGATAMILSEFLMIIQDI